MSFLPLLEQLPVRQSALQMRFLSLLSEEKDLEELAAEAQSLTRQNFGKTMRLFAPLYVSNECINICKYCGFSRDNPILRVTLTLEHVLQEARYLAQQGFRNILLVAGEHPRFVSEGYLAECIRQLIQLVPSVSLEVGPMEEAEYRPLVQAGAEGLVVYQETYHQSIYAEMHTAGPKKDFAWRLDCPERAYRAGFRRLGIGALFGLAPWEKEALSLAAHAEYLLKTCWKSSLTLSLPRLRPAAGEFQPKYPLTDREFTRLICALRVCFPQVGLVLSTREPAALRDGLIPVGITMMSAGAHTEPGGYTGVGTESLHRTEKGKAVAVTASEGQFATAQFEISDERSAGEIAQKLRQLGYDPVWKDWDPVLRS